MLYMLVCDSKFSDGSHLRPIPDISMTYQMVMTKIQEDNYEINHNMCNRWTCLRRYHANNSQNIKFVTDPWSFEVPKVG